MPIEYRPNSRTRQLGGEPHPRGLTPQQPIHPAAIRTDIHPPGVDSTRMANNTSVGAIKEPNGSLPNRAARAQYREPPAQVQSHQRPRSAPPQPATRVDIAESRSTSPLLLTHGSARIVEAATTPNSIEVTKTLSRMEIAPNDGDPSAAPEYSREFSHSQSALFAKTYRFSLNIPKTRQAEIEEKFIRISDNSPTLRQTMKAAWSHFGHSLPIEFGQVNKACIDSGSGKIILNAHLPVNMQVSYLIFETVNAKNLNDIESKRDISSLKPHVFNDIENNKEYFNGLAAETIFSGILKNPSETSRLAAYQHALVPDELLKISPEIQSAFGRKNSINVDSAMELPAPHQQSAFLQAKDSIEQKLLSSPGQALQVFQRIYGEQKVRLGIYMALDIEIGERQSVHDHIQIFEEAQENVQVNQRTIYKPGIFDVTTIQEMDIHGRDIRKHLNDGHSLSDFESKSIRSEMNSGHTYHYLRAVLNE